MTSPEQDPRVEAVAEWLARHHRDESVFIPDAPLPGEAEAREVAEADYRRYARDLLATIDSTQPPNSSKKPPSLGSDPLAFLRSDRAVEVMARVRYELESEDERWDDAHPVTRQSYIAECRLLRAALLSALSEHTDSEPEVAPIDCPACGAPAGYPCNAGAEGQALPFIHNTRAAKSAAIYTRADSEPHVALSEVVEALMNAQADLQTALGVHRLEMGKTPRHHDDAIEDRLAESLARLHALLAALGKPMYSPEPTPEQREDG